MTQVFVAVGSNLGDRFAMLQGAYQALSQNPHIESLRSSSVYETEAIGPSPGQPYLNAVFELQCALPPHSLLATLLEVEAQHGRERRERWGPRTLDLDLLFFGDQMIDDENLQVPHPRLSERLFVLTPLRELAPNLRHPVTGLTITELWSKAKQGPVLRKLEQRLATTSQ